MIKNIYAQNLNLDFELELTALYKIQNTITDYNKQHMFSADPEDIDKNLVAFLRTVNIVVPHVEIFYTPSGVYQGHLHVDGGEIGHNHAKLNWVFGSKKSLMRWFQPKLNIDPTVTKTQLGTDYIGYKRSDCSLVWSHKVEQPTLVNAGIAHCIDNMDSQGRWCVSFCLYDEKDFKEACDIATVMQWDEAVKRLQPWFKL